MAIVSPLTKPGKFLLAILYAALVQLVQVVLDGRLRLPPPRRLEKRVEREVRVKVPVVDWMFVKVSVTQSSSLFELSSRQTICLTVGYAS